MSKYICTVLTPDFKEKFDMWLENYTHSLNGDAEKFIAVKNFTFLILMYWIRGSKGQVIGDMLPEYLKIPETVKVKFDPVEDVFSTYPRIVWMGRKMKIEDVPEIIGYSIEV